MTSNLRLSPCVWTAASASVLFAMCGASENTSASVYANAGVRENEISVCFVGDPLTSRPDRVKQIQEYVSRYEYTANVFNFTGTCTAATQDKAGNDFYDGDIRIVIPNTSVDATVPIPGKVASARVCGGQQMPMQALLGGTEVLSRLARV
jgi:hypothetical protein